MYIIRDRYDPVFGYTYLVLDRSGQVAKTDYWGAGEFTREEADETRAKMPKPHEWEIVRVSI